MNFKAAPGPKQAQKQEGRTADQNNSELEEIRRLLVRKEREIAQLRSRLARSSTGTRVGVINPENIVWIFGHGRTGSTWLSQMMAEFKNQKRWNEPYVGDLFGSFMYQRRVVDDKMMNNQSFIMGNSYREVWLRSIRYFVLDGAAARFPELGEDLYLVVKEPNGTMGAPLIMEALPESRMILLVRDSRDVVASYIDANSQGGWIYERYKRAFLEGERVTPDKDAGTFVRRHAGSYLRKLSKAKEAYDAHQGYKALIRYEELHSDTLSTMKRIYSTLGIEVDEEELARVVKKHSWGNIPEGKKGEGKFYRKATPGGWREDLTREQVEIVENITAPLMKELYPHEVQSEGS